MACDVLEVEQDTGSWSASEGKWMGVAMKVGVARKVGVAGRGVDCDVLEVKQDTNVKGGEWVWLVGVHVARQGGSYHLPAITTTSHPPLFKLCTHARVEKNLYLFDHLS